MNGVPPRRIGDCGHPKTIHIAGKALRDAPPVNGKSYPLVIVSHGFPGSRYFLTYLSENLASKGYVVAAIDHTDSVFGDEKGFQSTLLNRANDQLFTIGALEELARMPTLSEWHPRRFKSCDCRIFDGRLWSARDRRSGL